jgi:hypothetical protein
METLKRILMFIMGVIFYPFISGYIMLENIGFFNKIKQYNWVAIITYTIIVFMALIWIKYFIVPLVFLFTGDVLD